jgi:hypothetical protein
MRTTFAALLLILLLPLAHAEQPDIVAQPILADTPEAFAAQAAAVRKEMQTGGRYEYIRQSDKEKAERLLGQMGHLFEHNGAVAQMNKSTQLELFNQQEEVNGLLKHNDSNRLVCERHSKVGSNLPETTCHTVAEIEHMRKGSQHFIQDLNKTERGHAGN